MIKSSRCFNCNNEPFSFLFDCQYTQLIASNLFLLVFARIKLIAYFSSKSIYKIYTYIFMYTHINDILNPSFWLTGDFSFLVASRIDKLDGHHYTIVLYRNSISLLRFTILTRTLYLSILMTVSKMMKK